MDRREFLKKSAAVGAGAGLFFLPKGLRSSVELGAQEANPDLVALKGGQPEAMFERGLQLLGGMGRFVKKGQTVVVKPNMSWDRTPEYGSNTSPRLVEAVVKQCFNAGAGKVYILDHSINYWERSAKNSGILDAARNAGAVYAQAEKDGYYHNVNVNGRVLKQTAVHETLLECDVLISVPVLKHHGGAGVTGAMKNLMGCIWNRNAYHSAGLHACIADFLNAKKPALNIVDAYRVITQNGPGGGSLADVKQMDSLIMSPDIVAADTAAFALVGRNNVEHVRLAAQAGFGQADLSKLKISRVNL